jgi:hypothetical protein
MAQRIFTFGMQRIIASCKKPANGGLSRDIEALISAHRTGWLGYLDSNQGMAVSFCMPGPWIIGCSNLTETSNNIIQKGLAFRRQQSGTVVSSRR